MSPSSPINGFTNGVQHSPPNSVNGDHMYNSVEFLRSNQAPAGWIIQKFGGTSVGKFPEKIAEEIVKVYVAQNKVAIVCSARSTDTKAEGTTNRLLNAAAQAMVADSTTYLDVVDQIREDHVREAKKLIKNPDLADELCGHIEAECGKLASFLGAAQIINEISPKSKDIIIGAGEKLSCRLMATLLKDRGVDAEYVNLENILPSGYQMKGGLCQSFYDDLAHRLGERLLLCEDRVPVITGFFGYVPGSLLDVIGRGYTDLCAALVAVGIDADELQVWKEVDGIFTADPRKVPSAKLLPTITPEEAAELTYYGSEVIHPYTMEQVIRARIPIRIKNVENPTGPGTVIFPDTMSTKGLDTPPHPPKLFRSESARNFLQLRPRRPTAVTIKNKIVVLNIHSNRKSLSHGFFANIFSTLDKYQLVVDLISTSEVHVSMALHAEVREESMRDAIDDLRKYGTVDVIRNMTILSLVGKHMRNMVGVAGRMFTTLAASDVNIEMISQGASEINISCVIDEKDATKALRVIHDKVLFEN
ncbi:Aspartokinase [Orbilia oligospora]|uniref:Aspartokinase n=2 Tax=Orbilia oligospora TaxID=2813651 RepID=A0A7C8N598_ORBOL|nr:Aspartokinase [Orbilia oligospora]KAF3087318.1 Aspartokinase [Orbilia oligospora]KAF3103629.1 Aspartokinase [Orbilia oligospora]KAF3132463.1 Aspartokinase [Orbilia oligospora]KAF3142618.1 Aspartokinase [Orbilia oligospora]